MTPWAPDGPHRASLVADHALTVAIDASVVPLVERWLPWCLNEPAAAVPPRAAITVRGATAAARRPDGAVTIGLGSAQGWLHPQQSVMSLCGAGRASAGVVDLAARQATLGADPGAAEARSDLYSMLTVSAGLLLATLGRALVHAAGVVSPDGEAWLLIGDARAGKSTTCANLVRAGWGYLSDDQVVLGLESTGVVVEGWLRPFHLDRGWEHGEASGVRSQVSPETFGPARWRRTAPLVGLLFPQVYLERPTALAGLSLGQALAGVVRQTPWLLAWRPMTPGVLALLQQAVETVPAYRLQLGRDSYGDGERISTLLPVLQVAS